MLPTPGPIGEVCMNPRQRELVSLLGAFGSSRALDPFTGPSAEWLTADPNVCFIEGDPPLDDTPPPPAPVMVDQKTMQGRIAQERKKLEAKDAELAAAKAELDAIRAEAAAAREAAEEAGKTASEKEATRSRREQEKLAKERDDARAESAAEKKALADAKAEIRTERVNRKVSDALSANKVMYIDKAARLAMEDISFEHEDDGTVRASFGDVHDGTIAEAVAAWAKENPMFLPAPLGGSGANAGGGGGRGPKPLHEMSSAERIRLARRK